MNELDRINEMLHIIETDLTNEQLRTSVFYDKLLELFKSYTSSIDQNEFSYYEKYDQLIGYENFLAHYSSILFDDNICPDDDLTGIYDFLNRFLRWNTPTFQKKTPSLLEVANPSINKGFLEKTSIKSKQQTRTSYEWQGKPDKELPELYRLMIDKYKLIASETTYEQFKAVFTGQSIDNGFEPIKWHQDNASELLYFIDRLGISDNIKYNPKRADYQKLAACFVKPDGMEFNAAWKSLKTNIDTNLSPDKQKAIDELVRNF